MSTGVLKQQLKRLQRNPKSILDNKTCVLKYELGGMRTVYTVHYALYMRGFNNEQT